LSRGGATTAVLLTGGTLIGLALLNDGSSLVEGKTYKKIWAAGLLTTGLAFAADIIPDLVGPFCILVIIASIANNPGVVGRFVSGGAPKAAAPGGKTATSPSFITIPNLSNTGGE
jgi:hypothetical protein